MAADVGCERVVVHRMNEGCNGVEECGMRGAAKRKVNVLENRCLRLLGMERYIEKNELASKVDQRV